MLTGLNGYEKELYSLYIVFDLGVIYSKDQHDASIKLNEIIELARPSGGS